MTPEGDKKAAVKEPKHRPLLLLGAIVIALLSLVFWKPAQRRLSAELILRNETLDESVFRELVQSSDHPAPLILKAWNTQRIPHRQAVMSLLKDWAQTNATAGSDFERTILAGAVDVDANVRELALGALVARRHPELRSLAFEQLRNADPQIRMLGLEQLRKEKPEHALPTMIQLLDDPDLRLAASAGIALWRWTGQDFGIRISQAIPKKDGSGRDVDNPSDLAAMREGIQKWKDWWNLHQVDFPTNQTARSQHPAEPSSPASDFKLQDLSGKTVRLSNFRGKTALLNFWTTWCTACLAEFPVLNELQRKHTNDLLVLGISLDGVPDEHGHVPRTGETHVDDEDKGGHGPSLTEIRVQVQRVAKQKRIAYRVLLDPKNEVGARYNGGELPTNVLIDARGVVQRRFVGARTLAVFEGMIAEIHPISESKTQPDK